MTEKKIRFKLVEKIKKIDLIKYIKKYKGKMGKKVYDEGYENMKIIMQATTVLRKKPRKKDKIPFEVGNLIFESKEEYDRYNYIDDNIRIVDKCIEDGPISADAYFNSIRDINVKQTFWGGWQELYELFPNAAELIYIVDDEMYDKNNNEIGSRFFNKIYVKDEKGRGIALP